MSYRGTRYASGQPSPAYTAVDRRSQPLNPRSSGYGRETSASEGTRTAQPESYYKKLYDQERAERRKTEASLIAELEDQMRLRSRLMDLLSELEITENELAEAREACGYLENIRQLHSEHVALKQQQLQQQQQRLPGLSGIADSSASRPRRR